MGIGTKGRSKKSMKELNCQKAFKSIQLWKVVHQNVQLRETFCFVENTWIFPELFSLKAWNLESSILYIPISVAIVPLLLTLRYVRIQRILAVNYCWKALLIIYLRGSTCASEFPLRKIPKFHLISWSRTFAKRHSFCRDSDKLYRNYAFPQNVHTRKLGEISCNLLRVRMAILEIKTFCNWIGIKSFGREFDNWGNRIRKKKKKFKKL